MTYRPATVSCVYGPKLFPNIRSHVNTDLRTEFGNGAADIAAIWINEVAIATAVAFPAISE